MIKNFQELDQMSAKCASCLSDKFTGNDNKRHIVLCGGTGCTSSGCDAIIKEMEAQLAAHDLEKEFKIIKTAPAIAFVTVVFKSNSQSAVSYICFNRIQILIIRKTQTRRIHAVYVTILQIPIPESISRSII